MSKSAKRINSKFRAPQGHAGARLARRQRSRAGYWFGFLVGAVAADIEERGEPGELTEDEVLAWGDEYYARSREWPNFKSGPIPESPGETWLAVEAALAMDLRGFAPGRSLPRFFAEHRGRYNKRNQNFSIEQILVWVDDWHARTGRWPTGRSGAVPGGGGLTWCVLDRALRKGRGGLPGGSTLACLLADRRGVRNIAALPRLIVDEIFAWASAHHSRTGRWPGDDSGPILEMPGETWGGVAHALKYGGRGLSGGSTLNRLIAKRVGTKNANGPPPLSIGGILAWADAFHVRTGRWPNYGSGPIAEAPGETWRGVECALRKGHRGLAGELTLARLLDRERGVRNKSDLRRMSVGEILRWADAHHERHRKWPKVNSGPIPEAPGETWKCVHAALMAGLRGLPGGSSLPKLLKRERGVRSHLDAVRLTVEGILAWADAHRARSGDWPRIRSGAIPETPGVAWNRVDDALNRGLRGLPGGSSLAKLLAERRGRRHQFAAPDLTVPQILDWADAFRARTGRWPVANSGQIPEAPDEKWASVDRALRLGLRGLPGGTSLAGLRRERLAGEAPRRLERAGDGARFSSELWQAQQ
jgi:hypothetical protein